MLDAALSLVRLSVASAPDAIRALAARLLAAGHVEASFERAALVREKRSPTGLPFAPYAVALPHAEPEHVRTPAIAIATLALPVAFRQMGSPGVTLDVSIVVMPALSSKEQAAGALATLVTLLQSDETRAALVGAASPEELVAVLAARWSRP